ncbi:UDP-N-acetylmuramoyl-L-alanine--D-glutamate ligase [Candidatus Saccharibacteria bacterium]|nr:UDP-N-acetylmuramoyl-L-alanine--D-glutamate ligase [Candidatus Saccharibacteria bacterium]
MKIGFAGWGLEAQSAFRFYGDEHRYVIANEKPRPDFPVSENVEIFSLSETRKPGLVGNVSDLSYLNHFETCDMVIYQPSIAKNLEKHFLPEDEFWGKAKTIQHIFFEKCPTKNIIGVTGTKGKGTTTTLIAKMLEAAGKRVHVGGNIGLPVLDLLPQISADDWVVLELSSFQLYKFPYSPRIAVHLMMMPEHIEEWHKTMEDYVQSKRNIFLHQKEEDFAIFYPKNSFSSENVRFSKGKHIPYTEEPGAYIDSDGFLTISGLKVCRKSEFALLGEHNIQNICAATTAFWQAFQDQDAVKKVAISFSGLEHRLEFVKEINGVKFYDDSFGTTPDTAIVAMDSFSQPKIMIVGGHDKGNPMEQMASRLSKEDVKKVIFIGSIGKKLYELAISAGLDQSKATIKDDGNSWTMEEIIAEARESSSNGDIVLLSTGCASFGIFQNYKDRGNQFKQAVLSAS